MARLRRSRPGHSTLPDSSRGPLPLSNSDTPVFIFINMSKIGQKLITRLPYDYILGRIWRGIAVSRSARVSRPLEARTEKECFPLFLDAPNLRVVVVEILRRHEE